MQVRKLGIEGAFEFTPPVFNDRRGRFAAPYQGTAFSEHLGKPLFQVEQVSHNLSARGTLRGIHYTATPPGMAKYVYCPYGQVQDFLVDLRVGSPTFGKWATTLLDADSCRALYIPVGVGHAFLSMADDSMVVYLMSQGYVAENELALNPLDPAIGLPITADIDIVQSDRDADAPTLAEARDSGLLPELKIAQKAEAALWQ
ncbi:dTDP-4-dehydrorhamnose 3,5-epimerase family protein [Streptomyces sp. NBC_01549]|uniref:dTDP-4-dehydrorhamnose 3,5-epimerase family protein n=1 Tax=Streptomyces sp. NBC_01549 TaxID=2975874 RepID=UPI00224FF407|nr:dTDP-4-dehydrorhamnose 3,5-epimerase family protein [Streptomyces sp. NBC_01549]MCX4591824.1 dTDP-4-dehydrorhamnose 3,5-epimerase family protein [Streptomyces sp. NBC_01549]